MIKWDHYFLALNKFIYLFFNEHKHKIRCVTDSPIGSVSMIILVRTQMTTGKDCECNRIKQKYKCLFVHSCVERIKDSKQLNVTSTLAVGSSFWARGSCVQTKAQSDKDTETLSEPTNRFNWLSQKQFVFLRGVKQTAEAPWDGLEKSLTKVLRIL